MKPLALTVALLVVNLLHCAPAATLQEDFISLLKDSRPTVWWRFMDDYASREGITADLDFMKHPGPSGGIFSYCSSRNKISEAQPGSPHVPVLSKEWGDFPVFQLHEATTRGLDLWLQASPGYATSGGPWIKPEYSMQKVVWKEVIRDAVNQAQECRHHASCCPAGLFAQGHSPPILRAARVLHLELRSKRSESPSVRPARTRSDHGRRWSCWKTKSSKTLKYQRRNNVAALDTPLP